MGPVTTSPDYDAALVRAQGNRFHREPTFGHGTDGARECWECTQQRLLVGRVLSSAVTGGGAA